MGEKEKRAKKIVYLLGAGATHAEKLLDHKIQKSKFEKEKHGLLARNVSKRVVNTLLEENPAILNDHGITELSLYFNEAKKEPYFDIELFISLLTAVRTEKSEDEVKQVRKYFREDIVDNLIVDGKKIRPRLHSSLIEYHNLNKNKEELIGFLTLNYDSILEKAFESVDEYFNYGFDIQLNNGSIPSQKTNNKWSYLLKLHGSFDWSLNPETNKVVLTNGEPLKEMQWVPPSLDKEYLNYPYNIIHGRAYELLCQCDILRIIGCSLSQNDLGLISLLFKTHRQKRLNPYSIEIIDKPDKPEKYFERLGMFLSFEQSFYENFSIKGKDGNLVKWDPTENSFLDWLYYKLINTKHIRVKNTKFLKKVEKWISQ